MYDPQATHGVDRELRRLAGGPRHKNLFILGIAMLALWFPVTFAAVVNYWESTNPVITLLLPHDEAASVVLLLWGLPGIPVLLLGYYGWNRPAPD